MRNPIATCPACGNEELRPFYRVRNVPVNSVLLLESRERAASFPTSDITLARCASCAFVFNQCFEPALTEYSGRYESTQAFSPTFSRFSEELAAGLIERHGIRGKTILEIGCGDGDFLRQLCALGGNRGVGYDPAYFPARHVAVDGVTFIPEFFREGSPSHGADLVVCKMTLEHIIDVRRFVKAVRRSLKGLPQTAVFFQVPNARYVFGEMAFWDVYYEHCSYFTRVSLDGLFRRSGFEVLRTWTGYDDQYLMLEARPALGDCPDLPATSETVADIAAETERFGREVDAQMDMWQRRVASFRTSGQRVALWGAGSKAVAFLAVLGPSAPIDITVDINPNKAGTFLPGSAHEIVGPHQLVDARPDVVIVMNPVYMTEVQCELQRLGLDPEVLAV